MKPSIGRIVHFVWHGFDADATPRCFAALVTDVSEPCDPERGPDALCVELDVRHRLYTRFIGHAPYCEDTTQLATWHWPERES